MRCSPASRWTGLRQLSARPATAATEPPPPTGRASQRPRRSGDAPTHGGDSSRSSGSDPSAERTHPEGVAKQAAAEPFRLAIPVRMAARASLPEARAAESRHPRLRLGREHPASAARRPPSSSSLAALPRARRYRQPFGGPHQPLRRPLADRARDAHIEGCVHGHVCGGRRAERLRSSGTASGVDTNVVDVDALRQRWEAARKARTHSSSRSGSPNSKPRQSAPARRAPSTEPARPSQERCRRSSHAGRELSCRTSPGLSGGTLVARFRKSRTSASGAGRRTSASGMPPDREDPTAER